MSQDATLLTSSSKDGRRSRCPNWSLLSASSRRAGRLVLSQPVHCSDGGVCTEESEDFVAAILRHQLARSLCRRVRAVCVCVVSALARADRLARARTLSSAVFSPPHTHHSLSLSLSLSLVSLSPLGWDRKRRRVWAMLVL
eukprot:Tamp_30682.p2 GENE.Tamp_30682~~Tamp_30682.p2  ORF type:complete len:141 (-),score=16.48 Tamp_30682:248-670(-)